MMYNEALQLPSVYRVAEPYPDSSDLPKPAVASVSISADERHYATRAEQDVKEAEELEEDIVSPKEGKLFESEISKSGKEEIANHFGSDEVTHRKVGRPPKRIVPLPIPKQFVPSLVQEVVEGNQDESKLDEESTEDKLKSLKSHVRVMWYPVSEGLTLNETVFVLGTEHVGDLMMVAEFLESFADVMDAEHGTRSSSTTRSNSLTALNQDSDEHISEPEPYPASTSSVDVTASTVSNDKASATLGRRPSLRPPGQWNRGTTLELLVLALLHPTSTKYYRKVLCRLLKPLVELNHAELSFNASMAETSNLLDLQVDNAEEERQATNSLTFPKLSSKFEVTDLVASELLVMYIKEHQAGMQKFLDEMRFSQPNHNRFSAASEILNEVLLHRPLAHDPLISHPLALRMLIFKFLVNELAETELIMEQIEERFNRIPELKKQVRKENVDTRNAMKELASIRRELRIQMASLEQLEWQIAHGSETVDEQAPTSEGKKMEDSQLQEEKVEALKERVKMTEDHIQRLMTEEKRSTQRSSRSHEEMEQDSAQVTDSLDSLQSVPGGSSDHYSNVFEQLLVQRMSVRNQAFGRDRHGREFWIFQSLSGLFLKMDDYGRACHRTDKYGLEFESLEDTHAEWYRFSTEEEIAEFTRTLDGTGMRFENERLLKKSWDKYRTLILEQINQQKQERLSGEEENIYLNVAQDILHTLVAIRNIVFAPLSSESFVFSTEHFRPLVVEVIDLHTPSRGSHALDPLRSITLHFIDVLCKSTTVAETKKTAKKRKKTSKMTHIEGDLGPLVCCFLFHLGNKVKPYDLKQVEKAISQWRSLVSSADNLDRLSFALRLLLGAIQEAVANHAAYTPLDDVFFTSYINNLEHQESLMDTDSEHAPTSKRTRKRPTR